ncbi:unnamed protein product [Adineta steineri]|uniref:Uncharacterized protein n=1 Tax=Adineta steineri TaxID=433720 RepID=A0A815TLB2_9BILA|nr:unnamed protein product [Adineta steineri]
MSEKEPLLNTSKKLPIDNDNDNENETFSHWQKYFNRQKTEAKNKKLDDEIKQTNKDIPISVFQLVRLFATRSFALDCHHQYENFTSTIINNSQCPFGIDLNSLNYDRLHKFCHYDNKIISSTLSPLTPLFRENVLNLVYLFFGFGIVTFLCTFIEYICSTIATKRQTSRMSILLFQSLIQRKSTIEYVVSNFY